MSMKGVAGVLALLGVAGTMAAGAADACGAGCARAEAGRPLISAHRGSRHEYDDNAGGGFRRSLAAGVRGFETDVRLTKDDELVIMHDKDVSRTTVGRGDTHDLTLAELTSLTLRRSGERVPAAKEVAELRKNFAAEIAVLIASQKEK